LQQRTYAALEPAMSVLTSTRPLPRAATRTGQALTVFLTLFFLFDSLPKLLQLPAVVEATTQMGFAPSAVPIIGAVLLVCLVLYLVPRTAILGAVLLTGYLGGAVCAQLRIEAPLFSTMLFPVYFGVVVWVALYLRSPQLRKLVAASLS
jgi:DoxX-like family